MDFNTKTILGRTGLSVGRLGISSSFGAPSAAYEEAFERGCNYFTLGTFLRGASREMKKAILNISNNGKREKLVLVINGYGHNKLINDWILSRRLKSLGLEYVDVFLLSFHQQKPIKSTIEGVLKMKEKGLARFIGLSGHNRSLFPRLSTEGIFDLFHIRYNAVNRGAEQDIFPFMAGENRQGIISYTATRWGQLLKESKMPPGETAPTATDCYRFVLSNPAVDVCMMGARNHAMMKENLQTLDLGPMTNEELDRMRKIGDHIYRRK